MHDVDYALFQYGHARASRLPGSSKSRTSTPRIHPRAGVRNTRAGTGKSIAGSGKASTSPTPANLRHWQNAFKHVPLWFFTREGLKDAVGLVDLKHVELDHDLSFIEFLFTKNYLPNAPSGQPEL
ncbi:hypothetical protein M404DRAFT_25224 [Pisolithus tinctorius Marx 270]|uniref:Uncharacterized protein n=1 Tax=Pisolithus tinctorius Marx 270 TaxID=870435 RepID=A0A0C3NXD9_PISTI|nr:hypothetical protein M404DRAFT_25224 [Pisolithus tinctorius Marx 270]